MARNARSVPGGSDRAEPASPHEFLSFRIILDGEPSGKTLSLAIGALSSRPSPQRKAARNPSRAREQRQRYRKFIFEQRSAPRNCHVRLLAEQCERAARGKGASAEEGESGANMRRAGRTQSDRGHLDMKALVTG